MLSKNHAEIINPYFSKSYITPLCLQRRDTANL
jgi:hypothetical protein